MLILSLFLEHTNLFITLRLKIFMLKAKNFNFDFRGPLTFYYWSFKKKIK